MNHYGQIALDHWAKWLPAQFAAIQNKESFFSDLGTRAELRIDEMTLAFAGNDPPAETYLAKVGRLGEARHRAEQIVLSEMILLTPEPEATETKPQRTRPSSAQSPRQTWPPPAPSAESAPTSPPWPS